MKHKIIKITSLICTLIICLSIFLPMTVFAATETKLKITGDDVNKMNSVFTNLGTEYSAEGAEIAVVGSNALTVMDSSGTKKATIISWDSTSQTLTFNGQNFEDADKEYKAQAMKSFTEEVTEQELSTTCRQNIADKMNEGSSQANAYLIRLTLDSTNADIFTALKWLGPILQFARVLIGVGAICLIILLVASTVMDCAYIGLPMWRESQSDKGNGKPFGVSMEALSTVKEVESNVDGGKYKNAYLVYFRRRALTYIVLAICILYLIAGELGGLIQGLLNLVSGFTS